MTYAAKSHVPCFLYTTVSFIKHEKESIVEAEEKPGNDTLTFLARKGRKKFFILAPKTLLDLGYGNINP